MKIRITGKGLPKAQGLLSQPGVELQLPSNPQSEYMWMTSNTQPPPVFPQQQSPYLVKLSNQIGTPVKNSPPIVPVKDFGAAVLSLTGSDLSGDRNTDETKGMSMLKGWYDPKGDVSRKRMKNYVNAFNEEYGTELKLPTIGPKLARTAKDINTGIGALAFAGNVVDYFDSNKKAKEWERYFRQRMMENAPSTEFEGIENINTGRMFENMLPKPNQGRFTFGGDTDNPFDPMKIRITAAPNSMEYGGQSGHGLDLGRKKIYADMPENKAESITSSISSVPRFAANIEAEGGETVYGDMDGDGALEHMVIRGPRHSEGGVPLNVPEGSFVFSDTAKMRIKDPSILAMFGKTVTKSGKKGYTPAELAKQYDINKYKAVMEDPDADPISKSTAQLMVNNYKKKLGGLALVQESMKGFPQGLPAVAETAVDSNPIAEAKFGGYALPTFQSTGQVNLPYIPEAFRITPEVKALIDKTNAAAKTQNEPVTETYTTKSPGQFAPMSDPEFQKYMQLLEKYDTKVLKDRRVINNMSDADAREFARLATKFGFRRQDDKGKDLFRVVQSSTDGYTIGSGKDKRGFFGGYRPELYERRVVEDVLGEDAVKNMTDVDIRKAYFKELGIDISDIPEEKLKDPKKLYTDPKFFDGRFYPQFTKRFAKGDYRTMLGDDKLIGAEHFDAYKSKPKEKDETVYGFICTGVNKDGYPQVQESAYMNVEARTKAGAYASKQEAMMNCPGDGGTGGDDIPPGKKGRRSTDFLTPDKLTLMAAAAIPPKGYFPFVSDAQFRPGQLALEDWLSQAQNIQQTYNTAATTLGNYQGPNALASNLSFMAGQAGDQVSQAISQVGNRNVDRFNQFAANETQRKQAVDMYNTNARDKRWDGYTITKQNLDNARRRYLNTVTKAANNMWANRMYLDLVNTVNPFFNIDPRSGLSNFMSGYGPQDLGRGSSSGGSGGYDWATMNKGYQDARRYFPNLSEDQYLRMVNPRSTSVDTNGDGIPERTSTSGTNSFAAMSSMLPLYMAMRNIASSAGAGANPFGQ